MLGCDLLIHILRLIIVWNFVSDKNTESDESEEGMEDTRKMMLLLVKIVLVRLMSAHAHADCGAGVRLCGAVWAWTHGAVCLVPVQWCQSHVTQPLIHSTSDHTNIIIYVSVQLMCNLCHSISLSQSSMFTKIIRSKLIFPMNMSMIFPYDWWYSSQYWF